METANYVVLSAEVLHLADVLCQDGDHGLHLLPGPGTFLGFWNDDDGLLWQAASASPSRGSLYPGPSRKASQQTAGKPFLNLKQSSFIIVSLLILII